MGGEYFAPRAHCAGMPIIHDEAFRAWEACVPASIRDDPMWKFHAYRVALYMLDLAGSDAKALARRKCFPFQTDQLLRAVASISANVAEGFGRSSAADRSRCFGIALGELRESFTWYRAVQDELPEELVELRFEQLAELRRILVGAQKWLATKPARSHLI
jgi:four helix bundle protein